MALAGFATALAALLLWTSLGPPWIERLVTLLFAVGAALSLVGALRASSPGRRRLAVIALGCNGLGLLGLLLLYAAG